MEINKENIRGEVQKFTLECGKFVVEYNPDPSVLINSFYVTATIAAANGGYSKEDLFGFISHVYDAYLEDVRGKNDSLEEEKAKA